MRLAPARALLLLAGDAARDALQRRLVFVVAGIALLGLATAETCTAFEGRSFILNGLEVDARTLAGWIAPVLYGLEALGVLVLAGLLAADHLARPLADGTATLWLARPVGRDLYAGSRLAGALGVAFAAGAILLGGTTVLLVVRHGLAITPALVGALVTALGAITVAALAMTASLRLGRIAVVALVVTSVPLVAFANGLAAAGVQLGGLLAGLDRFAPPIGRAILLAVAPWNPHAPDLAEPLGDAALQLAVWCLASVGLLLLAFRRVELAG